MREDIKLEVGDFVSSPAGYFVREIISSKAACSYDDSVMEVEVKTRDGKTYFFMSNDMNRITKEEYVKYLLTR